MSTSTTFSATLPKVDRAAVKERLLGKLPQRVALSSHAQLSHPSAAGANNTANGSHAKLIDHLSSLNKVASAMAAVVEKENLPSNGLRTPLSSVSKAGGLAKRVVPPAVPLATANVNNAQATKKEVEMLAKLAGLEAQVAQLKSECQAEKEKNCSLQEEVTVAKKKEEQMTQEMNQLKQKLQEQEQIMAELNANQQQQLKQEKETNNNKKKRRASNSPVVDKFKAVDSTINNHNNTNDSFTATITLSATSSPTSATSTSTSSSFTPLVGSSECVHDPPSMYIEQEQASSQPTSPSHATAFPLETYLSIPLPSATADEDAFFTSQDHITCQSDMQLTPPEETAEKSTVEQDLTITSTTAVHVDKDTSAQNDNDSNEDEDEDDDDIITFNNPSANQVTEDVNTTGRSDDLNEKKSHDDEFNLSDHLSSPSSALLSQPSSHTPEGMTNKAVHHKVSSYDPLPSPIANSSALDHLDTTHETSSIDTSLTSPQKSSLSRSNSSVSDLERSAVKIQSAYRSHLERSHVKNVEKRLQNLPLASPSTPAQPPSKKSKKSLSPVSLANQFLDDPELIGLPNSTDEDEFAELTSTTTQNHEVVTLVPVAATIPTSITTVSKLPTMSSLPKPLFSMNKQQVTTSAASAITKPLPLAGTTSTLSVSSSAIPSALPLATLKPETNKTIALASSTVSVSSTSSSSSSSSSSSYGLGVSSTGPIVIPTSTTTLSASQIKTIQAGLKMHKATLSDLNNNWTVRSKAMNGLETLIRSYGLGGFTSWSGWSSELDGLKLCVAEQLQDLRSSIVREACRLLIALAEAHPTAFEEQVSFFAPILWKGLYVTIKVISTSCDECMREILMRVYSPKLVPIFVGGMQDAHGVVREKCATYLLQLTCAGEAAINGNETPLESFKEMLFNTLRAGLQDSDSGVRSNTRILFESVSKHFTAGCEKLLSEMPSSVQKAIENDRRAKSGLPPQTTTRQPLKRKK